MSKDQQQPGTHEVMPHDPPTQKILRDKSSDGMSVKNDHADDTDKRAAVHTPPHRPTTGMVTTPRQERALRYLERKQTRQERVTGQISDDNGTGVTVMLPETSAALSEQDSAGMASTMRELQKRDYLYPSSASTLIASRPAIQRAQSLRAERHKKLLLRHLSRKRLRQDRREDHRAFNRVWLTIALTIATLLSVFLSTAIGGTYVTYRFYNDTQTQFGPKVLTLRSLLPHDNLKMYDMHGIPIGQLTDQGIHTVVTYNQISQKLVDATVAAEDKNFWTNPGVDITRIAQAALDNLRHGRVVEGGSTITQQLIKNLVVGSDTNILRKLEEVVLTPDVNSHYSKADIMEMYLDSIYYGEQAYGIDAAANIYFGLEDQPGKPAAQQLDIAQSAMLAGIPSSPYAFDPLQHPKTAFQRFQTVLDLMMKNQYITKIQALDAQNEAQRPGFFKKAASLTNRAPHFFNFVLQQLEQTFHLKREQLSRSDMSVYTTLDITLQDKIQQIAQQRIAELSSHNVTNAAEVLIDYHSGAIRTLLGSIDYNNKSIDGEFDVTQSYRQPGSSFKPYVYVTAFEQGASPAQAIADEPLTIKLPNSNPPTFSPSNYDNRYHGHMTLRCALQNSLNIPAVKVLQHVGIDAAMKTAHNMGVASYNGTPGYSLVLGGLGIRLLDHTSAYGTFANSGVHMPYYGIEKVVFASTHQTFGHPANAGTHVLSPQLAYMMTSVLSDNESRIPEFLPCNVLQLYANSQAQCYAGNRGTVRPAAAKTGTTNDFRDNWTIGYTSDYVLGVWTGNDNNSPMYGIDGVHGAAPIWHDALLAAEEGHPIRDFTNPGGLVRAQATYPDGVQTTDWFMPGTVPSFSAPASTSAPTSTPPSTGNNGAAGGQPYCPSSYTFSDNHPGNNGKNKGWW